MMLAAATTSAPKPRTGRSRRQRAAVPGESSRIRHGFPADRIRLNLDRIAAIFRDRRSAGSCRAAGLPFLRTMTSRTASRSQRAATGSRRFDADRAVRSLDLKPLGQRERGSPATGGASNVEIRKKDTRFGKIRDAAICCLRFIGDIIISTSLARSLA